MSLRDRIAERLYGIALDYSDQLLREWSAMNAAEREPWCGEADAILADPEIAALSDLAGCAVNAREHLAGLSIADDIDTALARLEEARRG